MTLVLMLLLQAASPAPIPAKDVVVTGHRLKDTADALAACIARHCPPDQDIAASVAHAENQFVGGDYKSARATLLASSGRNKRFARQYPVPVSDLLRANSRVAAHLGEGDDYRISTIGSLDALKAGLPGTDPRVLAQRVEVGDMFAHVGRPEAALETYRAVEKDARRLNLPVIEGTARLRTVLLGLTGAEATAKGSGERREAMAALDALAKSAEPRLASYAFVARVMQAQYAARAGDSKPLDAILAEMRARGGGKRPVLVYSQPIKLQGRPDVSSALDEVQARNVLTRIPTESFDKQWVDVSFWVKPDGSVADTGVLRQSPDKSGKWERPVLDSVKSRRYAPLALAADDPGVLRIERYTYTSNFDNTATGTRIRTRDGEGRVEMLDMTEEPARS